MATGVLAARRLASSLHLLGSRAPGPVEHDQPARDLGALLVELRSYRGELLLAFLMEVARTRRAPLRGVRPVPQRRVRFAVRWLS